jgi:hypothetical protein
VKREPPIESGCHAGSPRDTTGVRRRRWPDDRQICNPPRPSVEDFKIIRSIPPPARLRDVPTRTHPFTSVVQAR